MSSNNNGRTGAKQQQPVSALYGEPLPKDLEAEYAVTGSFMIDNKAYAEFGRKVSESYLTEKSLKLIFRAINELGMEGLPIDIITVTDRLASLGLLEEAGGPGVVATVSSKVATSANIEKHIEILRKKANRRNLILFFDSTRKKTFDETEDIDDIYQDVENSFVELKASAIDNEGVKLYNLLEAAVKEAMEAQSDGGGIKSGFIKFDELFGSFKNGAFGIIGARPSIGKTSLALSIARRIAARQDIPVGIFSLEMTGIELANSLLSAECEIESRKITEGRMSKEEWDRLDKRVNGILYAPLYVDDTPDLTVGDFRSRARRMVRENGVKIIFIDYIQLMSGGKRFNTRQEEISYISRTLKKIAKELDIPIIALSQLNRDVENRASKECKRPQLSDLRESGAIEQDADWVVLIHRPEYYHIYQDESGNDMRGKALLIIAKHRKGMTGDVVLKFEGKYTRFEDN